MTQEVVTDLSRTDRPSLGLASGTWVQVYRRRMDDLLSTPACTMPSAERPLRLAEFDGLFADAVRRVEGDGELVQLRMAGPAGLRERVRDLTDRESSCCSFFGFGLAGSDDDLVLTVRVPAEHREILAALADRAAVLSAGLSA